MITWSPHGPWRPGQLFPAGDGGLFFKKRADLDLFLRQHALAEDARILPAHHPLIALELIGPGSAGGRAHDELMGDGYALVSFSTVQRIPRWTEIGATRVDCQPGVRHPWKPLPFTRRAYRRHVPFRIPPELSNANSCPECEMNQHRLWK